MRRSASIAPLVALVLVALGASALADGPADALRAAAARTAAVHSGRVSIVQRSSVGGRTVESTAVGVLVGADSDLAVSGERGGTRRVSVGTQVKERRADDASGPWRTGTRPTPSQSAPFAVATLKDGTSIGDPKLYRTVVDAGTETLPQGPAHKLVGDLDMGKVAAAMQLGVSDQARMAQWKATLTLWVASDGTVARNSLSIVMPSGNTLDLAIDLSDLDAALSVTLP